MSDPSDILKQKIYSMYTDPNHVKVSDPGKVEGNVVFAYLDAFYEDKSELEELKSKYQKGGLGDMALKSLLNDTLQALLMPIREKRAEISDNAVIDILMDGSARARKVAKQTLAEVRDAIGLLKCGTDF